MTEEVRPLLELGGGYSRAHNDRTRAGSARHAGRGANWNAYVAPPGTLENWLLLGSISTGALVADPRLEDRFRRLMRDAASAVLLETFGGAAVRWSESPVPVPAEPSGRA